jgi:hypothetical protein
VDSQHVSIRKVGPMSAPKHKLPKAGDLCTSCAKFWRAQKLNPKYMVTVFDADGNPITTENNLEVVICPHCDGDMILNLDKHTPEEV